ncbi:MBL fold metallo-hydrolase [Kluyvera cryocrescens]|uniref:MBL fold metallo-hydrolase n=1 Tax=Kluyvera cryocrescens TaxID=580 RepID=A0AAW9C3U3_KLUCR|nr:MBL fold metallo-hydrolase [Kluyvera cryocrescens]MDW3776528.1 MBL fold metallo-hydrolase [Kluyvera cryocrescens]MEB7712801.1 MBL fold metallo-hydrolase [Kluyvera cryocrescens]WNN73589.1 MBL fold metallo-hydrolase [Kluyvera cryocrescens]HED1543008.1 MBL fold metallo-hydrolase [Kluyvera cryocrescens]HEP1894924.1 MBL fold metallo-hydrolase [Kluyvera cryocrescens]
MINTKVFLSSDMNDGFGVTSTIIYGDTDAILVDAQFTLANAHRLVADLMELKRDLKVIYLTHLHPDHYLGLEVIKSVYPNAEVVAYKKAADDINQAYDFKIDYWGNTILKSNGANIKFDVTRLEDEVIYLEGQPINILGILCGDCVDIAALWIPSTRTLVASDLVFSGCHVWVADMRSPEQVNQWLETLDKLEALEPAVVIPGHSSFPALTLSPSAIGFTRQYINDFFKQLPTAADADGLKTAMERIYPGLPVKICLEYSARILKEKYVWPGDWPLTLRHTPAQF